MSLRLASTILLLTVVPAVSQSSLADCSFDLKAAAYPAPARDKGVMDVVTSQFTVDASGRATQIRSTGNLLLIPGAVAILEAAHFPAACEGKSITVRLDFRLDTQTPASDSVVTRKLSEREFQILSHAERIVADPSTEEPKRKSALMDCIRRMKFW